MEKWMRRLPLLAIIAFNLYFIWYYKQHPDGLRTLFFLYWLQSVIIGFFTFVYMLGGPIEPQQATLDTKLVSAERMQSPGCSAMFFLVHYGGFHLVYLVFIISAVDGPLDYNFIKLSFFILLVAESMELIRRRRAGVTRTDMLGIGFFLPYLRIIPMHLALLGTRLFDWSDATVFLVLKMVADVLSHLLTQVLIGEKINR